MSENKHTPEPWRAFNNGQGVVGVSADRSDVCWTRIEEGGWLDSNRTIDTDYENARRITACVNACAGISQQYLEELNGETLADKQMVLITQRDEYSLLAYRRQNILDEVIKQRDELLAFAEEVRRSGDTRLASMAIAAIASVKGGA